MQEENVNWNSKRGLSECPRQYWAACLWCGVFCHEQKVTLLGFPVDFVGFVLWWVFLFVCSLVLGFFKIAMEFKRDYVKLDYYQISVKLMQDYCFTSAMVVKIQDQI